MAKDKSAIHRGATFNVVFSSENFICDFGEGVTQGDYSGPYEVTPTEEIQSLPTAAKTLEANVVINPIPDNYGRITWNGSSLIVS